MIKEMKIYKIIFNIRQYCLSIGNAYLEVCDKLSELVSDAVSATILLVMYLLVLPLAIFAKMTFRLIDKHTKIQKFWEDYDDFVKHKKARNVKE